MLPWLGAGLRESEAAQGFPNFAGAISEVILVCIKVQLPLCQCVH